MEKIPCSEASGVVCGRELEPSIWPADAAASRADGMKGPLACVAFPGVSRVLHFTNLHQQPH